MTPNSQIARELAEQPSVKPALASDVFNHDKHYRALVGWMKRRKMTANDLSELFAEGSTVAHEIWRLYSVEGWPSYDRNDRESAMRRQVELLAEKAERQSHEDAGNTSQYKRFKFVAAWLRSQIGEL